jgi:hypothetical protein
MPDAKRDNLLIFSASISKHIGSDAEGNDQFSPMGIIGYAPANVWEAQQLLGAFSYHLNSTLSRQRIFIEKKIVEPLQVIAALI